MLNMLNQLVSFLREESGPTIVEYAIMLVLIAIAVAFAAPVISTQVVQVFNWAIQAMTP
jgi:Flp pilus assembly pilin Flp